MNSVPVCASAKNPVRCSTAPVKLPRTCPNKWLSISPSGIAVQSSVTSGRSHRALCAWIARAISSLPVPDSPEMHTFASPGATFSIFASTSPSCADCPPRPFAPPPPPPAPPRPRPPPRARTAPPQPQPTHHPLQRRRQLRLPRRPLQPLHPRQRRRRPFLPRRPQHHHRTLQPQPPQPLPQLPRRQRRLQIHHRQRRPPVRLHRLLQLVQRPYEMRLPATDTRKPVDRRR